MTPRALVVALVLATAAPAVAAPFKVIVRATLQRPWAMTVLPDKRLLVTERGGVLRLLAADGKPLGIVIGTPKVDEGGQGGLGDVVLHPKFAQNKLVYLSWAEAGDDDTRGAAVGRAKLVLGPRGGRLAGLKVIWRQKPKVGGRGHFGHRLAFGPDGYLYVTSGERQKFDPAQDLGTNLGKVLRLRDDGTPAPGNPFASRGGVAAEIWSLGHRNPLGIAFDAAGALWIHEMGPEGGDELNRIEQGKNYGWPTVSNGDHYDGRVIPDHDTQPRFAAPAASWNPSISPAGFVIYAGTAFPAWRGDGLLGGLSSRAIIRVDFDGKGGAREIERYDMGQRIRELELAPGGGVFVLEDHPGGRLLELVAPSP